MPLKYLYVIVATVLVMGCRKEKPDHTISGQLKDAPEHMVYFEHITDSGEVFLDSVLTDKEGRFRLNNKAAMLDYYLFRVDAANAVFMVLKGGEDIVINGEAKDLENTYTLSGSHESELIRQLKKYDKYVSDSLFYVFKSAGAANPVQRDSLIRQSQAAYARRMSEYARRFIRENPDALASMSATRFLDAKQPADLQLMETLEKKLGAMYPDNAYVQKYSEGVAEMLALPIGSPAPDINLPDTAGKARKLSSLRGKIVLVDFWASWCAPCRKENPKVVELYKKYQSRGLEIFSVSLDDEKLKWKTAIRSDGLHWIQVSELKKWDTGAVQDYHVNAIPFTVLLDRKGNIIDKGLNSEELEAVLKDLL